MANSTNGSSPTQICDRRNPAAISLLKRGDQRVPFVRLFVPFVVAWYGRVVESGCSG